MKLRNKKTGEIVEWEHGPQYKLGKEYKSIKEFAEEWEDYEEPKDRWYINENGGVLHYVPDDPEGEDLVYNKYQDAIGNYFNTRKEAKRAVEKLKAWKRLKDKGFKFTFTPGVGSLDVEPGKFQIDITATMPDKWWGNDKVVDDLDFVFGGEDD